MIEAKARVARPSIAQIATEGEHQLVRMQMAQAVQPRSTSYAKAARGAGCNSALLRARLRNRSRSARHCNRQGELPEAPAAAAIVLNGRPMARFQSCDGRFWRRLGITRRANSILLQKPFAPAQL
jgi:uncharacterized protein YfaP (DUF2135 family)